VPDSIKTRVHVRTAGTEQDLTERHLRMMFKALKKEGWKVERPSRWMAVAVSPDGFRMVTEVLGPDGHPMPMNFLEDDDGEN
jgi:hypothetical protein